LPTETGQNSHGPKILKKSKNDISSVYRGIKEYFPIKENQNIPKKIT